MNQLEAFFEDIFLKKITFALPASVREVIVKIAPWLALIAIIFSLPAILGLLGLGSLFGSMYLYPYGYSLGFQYYLGIIVLIIQVIFMIKAFPGLQKRQMSGWKYAYYSNLLSAAYGIITSYTFGSVIGALIGLAIGLYILFQVKSYYKQVTPSL